MIIEKDSNGMFGFYSVRFSSLDPTQIMTK